MKKVFLSKISAQIVFTLPAFLFTFLVVASAKNMGLFNGSVIITGLFNLCYWIFGVTELFSGIFIGQKNTILLFDIFNIHRVPTENVEKILVEEISSIAFYQNSYTRAWDTKMRGMNFTVVYKNGETKEYSNKFTLFQTFRYKDCSKLQNQLNMIFDINS